MAEFTSSDDLRGATFTEVDLRDARFAGVDLSGAVLRGVAVADVEIDGPWLFDGDHFLRVNGVDVRPFVDAELNRRFPGREQRGAETPEGLRAAWEVLQRTWAATLDRVAALPAGAVDESVGGEWSFAQTLRHLVMATDVWLGRAIQRKEQPYHPAGLPNDDDGGGTAAYEDTSVFSATSPSYDEVLGARASRVAMVGDFLATVTPEVLAEQRSNPHAPQYDETVLSCLHTILDEEWEHHRYAVRDLDALASASEDK
ncbi:MAG TPA: DinB family protein [Flexivirga sp.]|uniref:DinB family protein n=1 Tax=Flexivirga sp. TaxID=1962927 RepID=UPI002D022AF7|nr:DinB family protein [Flexivirga sp.]HWC24597.1 DinB family protein [Flexivirga sp.]